MSESSFAKRQSRLAARAGSPPRRVDLNAVRKQVVAFFRKPPVAVASAGLLVLPDDPDGFAEALAEVLTDASRRAGMADAAAAAGRALPTWADTAKVAGRVLDRLSQASCA